jgi:hypothetical protein
MKVCQTKCQDKNATEYSNFVIRFKIAKRARERFKGQFMLCIVESDV